MKYDEHHNPDPNLTAARIVAESTRSAPELAADASLEAAWQAWCGRIQNIDERTATLLRAAFEAGYEAGEKSRTRT